MATTNKGTAKAAPKVTIIPRNQVKRAKRGRKPTIVPGLVDLLQQVPLDGVSAAVLESFAGTAKDDRAKVGSVIRNHWRMIHGDPKETPGAPRPRIEWDPETGTPQVSANV